MASIEVKSKTLRELLSSTTYSIDYYQREYRWDGQQVTDLIEDLGSRFLDCYSDGDHRQDVAGYGNYFLGSIILASREDNARYLIDGQQRLTSLTLLIIYLRHRLVASGSTHDHSEQIGSLSQMIFSESFGEKSFNVNIPERNSALQSLYDNEGAPPGQNNLSVQQIFKNYALIEKIFPEDITDDLLPYFIDWLLEKVEMVEMSSSEVDEAYTTFETMNDRGKPINPADVIKGFILSQIRNRDRQEEANEKWKTLLDKLRAEDPKYEIGFFKHWLRARYAIETRKSGVGTLNQDFEKIALDSEIARWVRSNPEKLGAYNPDDFYRIATKEMPFFAQVFLRINEARKNFDPTQPFIFYNNYRREFVFEDQLLLASLTPQDKPEDVEDKLRLVSGYVDIYLARRTLSGKGVSASGIKSTMATLVKELRKLTDKKDLAAFLKQRVADMKANDPGFERLTFYTLSRSNNSQAHWILARFASWLEVASGRPDPFPQLISKDKKKAVEIEHLLASNSYSQYATEFNGQEDFEITRNQLGALLLIPSGVNQSLGDKDYKDKLDAYRKTNLWAQTLHSSAYKDDPGFREVVRKYGLKFKPHEERINKQFINERNDLMIQVAEIVWNQERFDFALPSSQRGEWKGSLVAKKTDQTITMSDMIKSGKIRPGDTLSGESQGIRVSCQVRPDGQVEAKSAEGELLVGTLSGVALLLLPHRKAISGWHFWKVGGGRPLAEIRNELMGK